LGYAQHQAEVDFIHAKVVIEPIPHLKEIIGNVTYTFDVLKDVDSIFLDAKDMRFTSVKLNAVPIKFDSNGRTISVKHDFKGGSKHSITLEYVAKPTQTVYFLGWDDEKKNNTSIKNIEGKQIWTQGQGKYTSHWLPSFDDMTEKVEFDLSIITYRNYTTITNGKLSNAGNPRGDGKVELVYDMEHPMSSYLLAFVIGSYDRQSLISKSGVSLTNYFYRNDRALAEPSFRYTKRIFDFLEEEIDVPYPWQNYKQVPVRDFLYAGMENTGTTIFSDGYMVDSTAFIDKNYVNVNAHEMAHQWFGNLVTEKDGNHHWLHEGFATYYAYLAEKELFGADHYHWKLYRSFRELKSLQDSGEGQSLLDPKASSLTFYEKGALALHMLRVQVGDKAFRKGIKNYLKKFQFKNVTVSDFLTEMEKSSKSDLSEFKKKWLENKTMPSTEVKTQFAKAAPSLKSVFTMEADLKAAQGDDIDYLKYWNETNSIHFKRHLLGNYMRILPDQIIEMAFESDTLPIRQQLVFFDDVKRFNKSDYESLLTDNSYVTVENALIQLWATYPKNRFAYLETTKDIIGLPNKNVRLLWLTLATLTEGYNTRETKVYFDELSGYTSSVYAFEVRQTAFQYLKEAFGFTEQNLLDLIQGTTHHSWQFKKFSRALLDDLLEDEVYQERIVALVDKLKPEEKRYIQSKLPQGNPKRN